MIESVQIESEHVSEENQETVYTLEDAIETIGFGKFQVFMFFMCGMMWSADSMETMLLSFLADGAQCEWDLCPSEKALLSMIVFVGMLLGAPVWGYISDIWGRKRGFGLALTLCFVSAMLSAFSPRYAFLIFCRFLVGFGIGGAHIAFGMCTEWLPNAYRGRMMLFFSIFWTLGIIFEILLAWLLLPSLGLSGWRYLLVLSSLPLLLLLLCYPLLPESPRFLYATGRQAELEALLAKVARWNHVTLPGLRVHCVDFEAESVSNWRKLVELFSPTLRTRTILLLMIWFADAAIYYGVFLLVNEIFKLRYFTQSDNGVESCGCQAVWASQAFITNLLSVIGELPGLAIAGYLLEKIGRTWTQTVGFYITGLMAIYLIIPSGYNSEVFLFFVLRSAINSAFQISFLASAELYPTRVRSTALGTFSATSRIGAMIAPIISQVLVLYSPTGSLLLYALFAFLNGTLSIFLPESMGHSLVE